MTEPQRGGKSTVKEEKAKRKKTQQKRNRKHGGGKNGIQIPVPFFVYYFLFYQLQLTIYYFL